jgi:hypothetical protein
LFKKKLKSTYIVVKICKNGCDDGLSIWDGFFFLSLIFHLVLVNDKQNLSSFDDELSFVSWFLPILLVISYQQPIFFNSRI